MATKIVLPGFLAGLATLIITMATGYLFMLFPAVAVDYTNPAIMRDWHDPLMVFFFAASFVQCWVYAWVWDKTKALFQGTKLVRALNFGFVMWLIATVPGMVITYGSFTLSLLTIVSWTLGGLLSCVAAGLIFVKMNGSKVPEPEVLWN